MSITEKIKIVLIKRNMSVKELSEKIGCSSQNLSNKFKRDNFSINELEQICNILNCDLKIEFVLRDSGESV
jgi:DNA-binding Xre family transcriptional regulator